MKSSILSTFVWVLNVGVLAVGGYFLFKNFNAYKGDLQEASGATRKAQAQTFKPKSWIELASGSTNALSFSNVPLVVGARENAVKPAEPGTTDGTGPEVKPPVASVNLQEKADKLREEVKKAVTVGLIFSGDTFGGFCYLTVETQGKKRDFALDVGRNLKDNPNVKALVNRPADDKGKDAFYEFPYFDMELSEIRTAESGARIVVLAIDSAELAAERAKVEPAKWTPALLPNGRVLVEIERTISGMPNFGDIASGPVPVAREAAAANTDLAAGNSALLNLQKLPQNKDEAAAAWAEEDQSTRIDPNNPDLVNVGWEDLNESAFEALVGFAETWIDPATNEAAGIRVKDSLPGDNNLIRRAGGRSGDVIKSINGQPVRNMPEVKSVVSNQRNAGVTDFVVVFERNGLDQNKTFKMPKKK